MRLRGVISAMTLFTVLAPCTPARAGAMDGDQVRRAMKRATEFMVEKVSNNGGYLWNYAPDFSRVWGELEAKPSMIWMERGTPAMGNIFLDAYHATGDEYYFKAAEAAAAAVIWAQLPCGGWNYMADFAGEASLRDWYETVAEGYTYCAGEHKTYQGNATYDDGTTTDAAEFLLRMYTERYDPKYRPAIDKAMGFLLESQYPIGGWPQRYPLRPGYTSFITINDGVLTKNIGFLLDCHLMLGDERVLEPISRAMTCVIALQGGKPQAGWALQHKTDLTFSPGHARDFEPEGYSSTATAEMIGNLMYFYRLTGDRKFLARIPEAFDFLESIKFGEEEVRFFRQNPKEGQILCPTFVEPQTNEPIYLHRADGRYWTDHDRENLITHYKSYRTINMAALRAQYVKLLEMSAEEASAASPLLGGEATRRSFPEYVSKGTADKVSSGEAERIVRILEDKDYWPGKLPGVSHENPGFSEAELPSEVISTSVYMQNMAKLIAYLSNAN